MHKLVNSSWFTLIQEGFVVNSHKKTINHQPSTINRNSTGFTLVELLVVIAILGVLASFTSVTLIGHQKKARDAQRKSDLSQVARAMQSAKNDCKAAAYYPYPTGSDISATNGVQAYIDLVSELKLNKYLNSTINDPKIAATPALPYAYSYFTDYDSWASGGLSATTYCPSLASATTVYAIQSFMLRVKLEYNQDPDIAKSFSSCPKLQNTINASGGFYNLASQPSNTDGYYYVCNE